MYILWITQRAFGLPVSTALRWWWEALWFREEGPCSRLQAQKARTGVQVSWLWRRAIFSFPPLSLKVGNLGCMRGEGELVALPRSHFPWSTQTPNSALLMDGTAKAPPRSAFAALQLYWDIIDTAHLLLNKEGSFLSGGALYERIAYSRAVQNGSH